MYLNWYRIYNQQELSEDNKAHSIEGVNILACMERSCPKACVYQDKRYTSISIGFVMGIVGMNTNFPDKQFHIEKVNLIFSSPDEAEKSLITQSLASASASAFSTYKLIHHSSYTNLRYTFYIWHTHALGQDLFLHAKCLTPVTLTLTSKSAIRFQNLRLGFENSSPFIDGTHMPWDKTFPWIPKFRPL